MSADEESALEAKCRELMERLSPEEAAEFNASATALFTQLATAIEQHTVYEKELLRRLGAPGDLDDHEEYYLRLWAAARHMGLSTDEFWKLTPREFCAMLELKVHEMEVLSGVGALSLRAKQEADSAKAQTKAKASPQPANPIRQGRKRGPQKDYATAERVAKVVADVAPDGDWRAKLDQVCDALDDEKIPCPRKWRIKDLTCRGWSDQLDRSLSVKAIEYRLKVAKQQNQNNKKTLS